MATKTVKVKPGQTYANMGYEVGEVMALNKGVPRLSTGQIIKVPAGNLSQVKMGGGTEGEPKRITPEGRSVFARTGTPPTAPQTTQISNNGLTARGTVQPTPAYGGSYNPTAPAQVRQNVVNALTGQTIRTDGLVPAAVGNNSGYGPVGYSGNVVTGVSVSNNTANLIQPKGYQSQTLSGDKQGQLNYPGFQTPTTNGFHAQGYPGFQTPTTNGFRAQNTVPLNQTQIQAADGTVSPPKPTVPFNPNDATSAQQWRDLWNWQAQHPAEAKAAIQAKALAEGKPDPFAPKVMTSQQIWEMKAAQRRKAAANQDDGGGGGGFTPSITPQLSSQPYWNFGNAVSAGSWRVG